MVDVIDNSAEFLPKLYEADPLPITTKGQRDRRRMIDPGLGARQRVFTGVIYGSDVLRPASLDFSGAVKRGKDLPSMQQLAEREQAEEVQKEFLKNKDKFPKKDDGRFKI